MTLKELKKMIAEEYSAYLKEQDMPTPPPGVGGPAAPKGPTVNVTGDDVDLENDKDAEATLKKMFDMLKDFFEGGEEEAPEAPEAEEEEDEDEEEDIEENKAAGNVTGYKAVKESKKPRKVIKESAVKKLHSEMKLKARFKKLANI